ncbi:MAG: tail fiber domain-containing protein [Kiritimatiellae bacterium]|nr:tail fiber domain-containing protein [Kiritimatiellia bacterium]
MKTRTYICMAALLLGAAAPAGAQAPSILNYQGRVAVGGTNYDGSGQFRFALVNGAGTTTYWSNGVNAVTTTVTKGLYSVLLGDTNEANMGAMTAALFTNSDVRLRVWFAPQGSTPQLLSPDQRVAASGYALVAANADNARTAGDADELDGQHGWYYLNAANTTGTVNDARLSTNIPRLNASQNFSGANHFLSTVGIGVTNPQKRLEVRATSSADGVRVDGIGVPAGLQWCTNGTMLCELGVAAAAHNYSSDAAPGDAVFRFGRLLVLSGSGAAGLVVATNNYVGIHKTSPATPLDVNGTVTATAFAGSGAGLTGVNADQVDGLHAASFAQLTSSPTFTGTVHAAGFAGGGASLTGVNADQVDGLHAASFAQLSSSPTFTGTVHAAGFAGNGASVTGVNADQLDGQHGWYYLNFANMTGAVTDALLSTNIPRLNAAQNFSGANHFLSSVGIGVTNPQKRLEVRVTSAADGLRVDGAGAGVAPAISFSTNDTVHGELGQAAAGGQYSTDAAGGDFVIRNNSGKVLIQNGGGASALAVWTNNYVGIHKTNPSTALDVNGTVTATAFHGDGSALTNLNVSTLDVWGKTMIVGQSWGDGPFQVYGSKWVTDQTNANFGWYLSGWGAWQSFTAGTNGTLAAVQAYVYSYTGGLWTATLSIYNGEGATGAVLCSQTVGGDHVNQARTFTLESPVSLIASNQYTFYFHNYSAELTVRASTNVYARGRSSYSVDYDYHFSTYMIQTAEVAALVVQPNTLNVGIGTTNPTNKLHVVGTVQATAYLTSSDSEMKENFRPVDAEVILDGVSALPMATWNFKDDASGTHLGPMAQDFHAAFGLGNTERGIFTVDADGVALAAIQGLNRKLEAALQAKEREIAELHRRVEQLEKLLPSANP